MLVVFGLRCELCLSMWTSLTKGMCISYHERPEISLTLALAVSWAYNMNENPISEIDFLEGNGWTGQAENTVSLHTCGRCAFPNLKGPELRRDCDLKGCEGTPSNP